MYRVLVWGMSPSYGGIESFIINYYRKIDRNKISFDFVNLYNEPIAFEAEIKSMGGKILHLHLPRRNKNFIGYYKNLDIFFKKYSSKYSCIWFNLVSLANIYPIKYAKKYKIPKIIVHSHDASNTIPGKFINLRHARNKKRIDKYATDFWACSSLAAEYFYRKDLMSKVKIIKNAIDPESLQFNVTGREEIRKKINADKDLVIGMVGRLAYPKNQKFAIDVLRQILSQKPNVKLVLVGDGSDKENLQKYVRENNLKNKVLFVGTQSNLQNWYSAFDIFLFPSICEGLGIVLLEAQANGLPIVTSINIPGVKINSNFLYLNLKKGTKFWANSVINNKMGNRIKERQTILNRFIKTDNDINIEVRKLEDYLLS